MGDDEGQIIDLLEQKAKCINSIDDNWIAEWATLIEKHFKHETRNHIRLKAISLLSQIFSKYHIICGDDLMNKIILPNFSDVDCENDSVVRRPIVYLLFDIIHNCLSHKNCNAILAIIRRILTKPFKQKQIQVSQVPTNGHQPSGGIQSASQLGSPLTVYAIGNADIIDSRLIISHLNKLFRTRLHRLPIDPAVNMLDISVSYLSLIYRYHMQEPVPAEIPMIRRELFSFFLNLRCNEFGHLGIMPHNNVNTNEINYSPFVICARRSKAAPASPPISDQMPPIQTSTESSERNNSQTINNNNNTTNVPNSPRLEHPPNYEYPHNSQANILPQAHNLLPTQKTSGQHQQRLYSLSSNTNPQSIFVNNNTIPNCPIDSRCVNLDAIFMGIIDCINQETDLDILKLVLDGLPGLLANKPLILTIDDDRINQLCMALSNLVLSQGNKSMNLISSTSMTYQTTQGPISASIQQRHKADVLKPALRCLASLLVYKRSLEHRSIKIMLAAFEDSLKSLTRHPIVPLFTTCLVELQDSSEMSKFIPVVLSRLGKFTPTNVLGISMLEFLSYLILFPKLYENFSQDEYTFIFAIALPYTNPFRFSDYITCLAFRVIAMWYLNCRPSLRCVFVELVKKSLQSNVIQPFKENHPPTLQITGQSSNVQQQSSTSSGIGMPISAPLTGAPMGVGGLFSQASSPINQTPPITYSCPASMSPLDQRKRSSSLNTENNFRHYNQLSSQHAGTGPPYHNSNNAQLSLQVNEELIETFADLLSRYTHGQYLAIAPKNRCTETLLDRNTSQTWLIGNSLITITAGKANNGWAEILVRRPTGNTSWIGKLQNAIGTLPMYNQQIYLNSLNFGSDIISLFSTLTLTTDDCREGEQIFDTLASISASSSGAAMHVSTSSSSEYSSSGGTGGISSSSGTGGGSANGASGGPNSALREINNGNSSGSNACYQRHLMRDPITLPRDKKSEIALSNFDLITPYETHKVGVIYVGENQVDNRPAILSNKYGSQKYYQFLSRIGNCIVLKDIDPEVYFIGGLDVNGTDGKYAYFWKDNVTQVIFHVATFMLSRENDPQCNSKNRHIGNDFVCIVYNDSGQQFKMSSIKGTGQCIQACIIIVPLDNETYSVEVECPDLRGIVGDIEPRVLSNNGASLYARQMAIHLDLASKIYERRHGRESACANRDPYVSNWVERLRCIKRIRQRLLEYRKALVSGGVPANASGGVAGVGLAGGGVVGPGGGGGGGGGGSLSSRASSTLK